MNGRAYTYDCHGWIEGITTSIPGFVPSLPELPGLQGSVSNDFYRLATTGIWTADTLEPMPVSEDYTERVMYATGSHPRYDGTASAHVATAGGRYDYLFDCHDRLTKAVYTAEDEDGSGVEPHTSVSYRPDFSTEYTYNAVGVPLTVKRYGVQRIDNSSGTPVESFGVLDNLSYTYDGMLLSSVLASSSANGMDFYGRTGFPLSYEGGIANYEWNAAGLLNKDSAREITDINYNWTGQPTKITFTDKGYMAYSYASTGALRKVETYAMLTGKRATKVSERTYCGDFVFEGDSLLYANFGGGYFDGAGQPHYRHADFQGNITMVTDCQGQVEQHTGYYPYGEPWREPTGQPYLYAAKERMRDHALNDYDFGARRLSSALCLWTTPDPKAIDTPAFSPYSYGFANSVKFVDPNGQKGKLTIDENAFTIQANYHTLEPFVKSLQQGIDILRDAVSNLEVEFRDKDTGLSVTLDIELDLNVITHDEVPGYKPRSVVTDKVKADETGNAYWTEDEIKIKDSSIQYNGLTSERNCIQVRTDRAYTETVSHEVGHTLGLDHYDKGIMTPHADDPGRNKTLNPTGLTRDFKEILKNGGKRTIIINTEFNIDIKTLIVMAKKKHNESSE